MKLMRSPLLALSVPMLSLALAACGGPSPPPQNARAGAPVGQSPPAGSELGQGPSLDIGGEGAAEPEAHSMSQAQQGPGSTALTDNEIVSIVSAADTSELEQAKLAQTKAKDPRVKKYAAHMLTDHTESAQKEMQVMTKAGLKGEDTATSAQLTSDSGKVVDSLKTQTGTDFDRMYIDAQVKQHQQLLDMIDHKFMASVKSPDLKGFLQNLRPKVEAHLNEAKEIQKSLPVK